MALQTRFNLNKATVGRNSDKQRVHPGSSSSGIVPQSLGGEANILENPIVNPAEATPEIVDQLRQAPQVDEPTEPPVNVDATLRKSFRRHVTPFEQDDRPKREQLGDIKRALSEARSDLMRQFRDASKNDLIGGNPEHGDICDLSAQDIERSISLSLRERDRIKLHAIEDALARLRDGSFGTCEECESPIPIGRLRIMPFATTCVSCKSRQETVEKIRRQSGDQINPHLYSYEFARFDE
jgi:DnaK suppressor protein